MVSFALVAAELTVRAPRHSAAAAAAVVPSGAGFVALRSARLLDTRPAGATVDGRFRGGGRLHAGTVTSVVVAGRGGVPKTGATAVLVTVRVVRPAAHGYVAVFAAGGRRPATSNVHGAVGQVVANQVLVALGTGGAINVFSSATTDLVVDVEGWWPAGRGMKPVGPARLVDTRPGQRTVDGRHAAGGMIAANGTLDVNIAGRVGMPTVGVDAVAVTIAVVRPVSSTAITAFASGSQRPRAATATVAAGRTSSTFAIVKVGTNGRLRIHASSPAHVIVDISAWFAAPAPPVPSGRVDRSMLRYQGAFRMPVGTFGGSRFGYGGGQLALGNRPEPTLFVGGYGLDEQIAEVTIPTPTKPTERSAAGLAVATIVQPFGDPTGGLAGRAINDHRLGGMTMLDGSLHWSVWKFYNVEGTQLAGHGWSSPNLQRPASVGLYTLGRLHNQMTGGYVFTAPKDWADRHTGGRRLIAGNTVSTATALTSSGPSFIAYRPVASGGALDALTLTYYPWEQHELAGYQRPDRIGGATWVRVRGMDSVLVVQRKSLGATRYGVGRPGDCSQDQGWHGDPYEAQFMLYSAADLAAAAAGTIKPWDVKPYQTWSPNAELLPSCDFFLGGAAFDERTGRLYVSQIDADRVSNEYESMPVVHVWQIS